MTSEGYVQRNDKGSGRQVVRVGSRSSFFLLGMMHKQAAKLQPEPVVQVLIILSVARMESKKGA